MSYNIELTENFKNEAKRLSKKYLSLKNDLAALGAILSENPATGTNLGNKIYKMFIFIYWVNRDFYRYFL